MKNKINILLAKGKRNSTNKKVFLPCYTNVQPPTCLSTPLHPPNIYLSIYLSIYHSIYLYTYICQSTTKFVYLSTSISKADYDEAYQLIYRVIHYSLWSKLKLTNFTCVYIFLSLCIAYKTNVFLIIFKSMRNYV